LNKIESQLANLEESQSQTSTEIAATWNTAHENLLASIADRCNCYRWMHSKCQAKWDTLNFYLTIPSIIMSTLVGSATIGLPNLVSDTSGSKWATTSLGVLTLSTGILTSVNQYMKSSQMAEANRAAMSAYGKLYRVVSTELALRRDQRLDALSFLKTVRSELDRLQDTSPAILESVITEFKEEFKDNTELEKPEIAGDLEHVLVNRTTKVGFNAPSTPSIKTISIVAPSSLTNLNNSDEYIRRQSTESVSTIVDNQ